VGSIRLKITDRFLSHTRSTYMMGRRMLFADHFLAFYDRLFYGGWRRQPAGVALYRSEIGVEPRERGGATSGIFSKTRPDPAERRKDRRIATKASATMRVLGKAAGMAALIQIIDVSTHGLRINVPRALKRNVRVEIRVEDMVIIGKVRYCVSNVRTYHAGVLIEEAYPGVRIAPLVDREGIPSISQG